MNKSCLYFNEAVPNSKRKTNGAKVYYPVLLVSDSSFKPALFSINQILVAQQRAELQPEDVPQFWEGPNKKPLTKFQKFVAKLVGIPVV